MFPDVVDEEGVRFIETVSKAQGIGLSVIRDFVTRTLLRIAYGIKRREWVLIVRDRTYGKASVQDFSETEYCGTSHLSFLPLSRSTTCESQTLVGKIRCHQRSKGNR